MDFDLAVKGFTDARANLRSKQGTNDPAYISENMMRLAHYTSALEDHLADKELELERSMAHWLTVYGAEHSATKAENMARVACAEEKGTVARLIRLTSSGWKVVSAAQSRWSHLQQELGLGKHTM